MNEFVCPNGKLSVNGVCPIFEGAKEDKPITPTPKNVTSGNNFFKFDFEKPTESAFESAGNIINNNISAYNNYVEDKLGIPSGAQNVLRIGSAITSGSILPFALPFIAGGALNKANQNTIMRKTLQDNQGAINRVVSPRIMNIKPTAQDIARGGGGARSTPSAKTSQGVTSAQHAAFRM